MIKFFSDKPWYEYRHLAFDIDGTLLNSNLAHVWAWQDAIEAEHLFLPHLSMFLQMGLPGKYIVEKFGFLFHDENVAKRIEAESSRIYAEKYVKLVAAYDGTYKLLRTLKKRHQHLYAITSASKQEADAMLERFKLNTFFEHVLTSKESGKGKPSPDPFLRLKEIIGTNADLVSFGDSPYDHKASLLAKVPFVYIGHGGFPREWFDTAQARFFNINEMLLSLPKRLKVAA